MPAEKIYTSLGLTKNTADAIQDRLMTLLMQHLGKVRPVIDTLKEELTEDEFAYACIQLGHMNALSSFITDPLNFAEFVVSFERLMIEAAKRGLK